MVEKFVPVNQHELEEKEVAKEARKIRERKEREKTKKMAELAAVKAAVKALVLALVREAGVELACHAVRRLWHGRRGATNNEAHAGSVNRLSFGATPQGNG